MPTYELREEADKVIFEEGTILIVEVVSIKEQEKKSQRTGKDYKKLQWTFAIQAPGEEYDGQYIYGDTFPDFSTRSECELRSWAQSIMAVEFPKGFSLNTDDLIGMQCRLAVGWREYDDPKDNTKKRQTNFVRDVFPSEANMSYAEEPF